MGQIVADRVKETTTSTGTGAITLAAAITGFRRFSAVCSVNDTVYYCIQAVDGSGVPTGDWEVGLGTYSAANTLTRTTILASSNANAAVNFGAGTKQVWLDLAAKQLTDISAPSFKGAQLKLTGNKTYNAGATSAVAWDASVRDSEGFWNSAAPTRLTVPAGVTKVRVGINIKWEYTTGRRDFMVLKNGVEFAGMPFMQSREDTGAYESGYNGISAVIDVVAGDYFEAYIYKDSSQVIQAAAQTWFAIEVVEAVAITQNRDGAPSTTPLLSNFSWQLQGAGVTATQQNHGISLYVPNTKTATLITPQSASNYTVTARLRGIVSTKSYQQLGIARYDSASTKMVQFAVVGMGSYFELKVSNLTGGVFQNDTGIGAIVNSIPEWWRIVKDATNFYYQLSPDGVVWATIYTHAISGNFLTATTHAGLTAVADNYSGVGVDVAASLLSWKVE